MSERANTTNRRSRTARQGGIGENLAEDCAPSRVDQCSDAAILPHFRRVAAGEVMRKMGRAVILMLPEGLAKWSPACETYD